MQTHFKCVSVCICADVLGDRNYYPHPSHIPVQRTFLSLCKKTQRMKSDQQIKTETPPPSLSPCVILCCRVGAIFIRASYGTSHGQNNISAVVTGM